MNRMAKLICWLAIGEMSGVGLIAAAVRWPDISHHPGTVSFLHWRLLFAISFFPAWAAFGVHRTDVRLRPKAMVLSPSYRRFSEAGMVAAVAVPLRRGPWSGGPGPRLHRQRDGRWQPGKAPGRWRRPRGGGADRARLARPAGASGGRHGT